MSKLKIFLPFSLLLILISPICLAMSFDGAYIKNFVKTHLEENLTPPQNGKMTIKVANIDPRITIKPCETPLKANIPEKSEGRNVNVKISCDDSTPWKIYLSARVTTTFPVLVAKTTIAKGSRLDKDNTEIQYIAENKIRGEKLTNQAAVLGSKSQRRVTKGRPIQKKYICIVCKGDAVTIIAKSSNFSIKTQGIALSSGNINQQIRVKNIGSGKVITPQVKAINQVVINL